MHIVVYVFEIMSDLRLMEGNKEITSELIEEVFLLVKFSEEGFFNQ